MTRPALRLIDTKAEARRQRRAERQRAYRCRKRKKWAVAQITYPIHEAAEFLIANGLLDWRDAENRKAIEAAIENMIVTRVTSDE